MPVAATVEPRVFWPTALTSTKLTLSRSTGRVAPLPRAQARTDPLPVSRWSSATLSDRVRALCAGKTPQTLAKLTGASSDSVRRYLRGSGVPPSFLVSLATAMGVSLNWLLSGRGPIRRAELVTMALDRATNSDLLTELSRRLSASSSPAGPVHGVPHA